MYAGFVGSLIRQVSQHSSDAIVTKRYKAIEMNTLRISTTVITIGVLLAIGTVPTLGQSKLVADSALATGNKELAAGNYAKAISAFTKSMTSESLSTTALAKVLYQRGAAYRNDGKPAHAIADLTKALWLKKLSPKDRSEALRNRSLAYKAVGQKRQAASDLKRAGSRQTASKPTQSKPTPHSQKKAANGSWQTAVASQPAKSENKASKTRKRGLAGFIRKLRSRGKDQPSATAVKPAPAAKTASASRSVSKTKPSAGATVSATNPTPSGWQTDVAKPSKRRVFGLASREELSSAFPSISTFDSDAPQSRNARRTRTSKVSAKRSAAVSGGTWTGSTKVAAVSPPKTTANDLFTGYRIQLAAVSSKTDAKQTWRQLVAKHRTLLTGWDPEFRNVADGGAYGVQIGPFADKDETQALCKSFKKSGLDCFIVSR
ncbi:hypothetical protein MnTg02_00216 [bacterium MnTg02]|nr:hypothetical protein MnTg02_00216 [bacterium MnTg02]